MSGSLDRDHDDCSHDLHTLHDNHGVVDDYRAHDEMRIDVNVSFGGVAHDIMHTHVDGVQGGEVYLYRDDGSPTLNDVIHGVTNTNSAKRAHHRSIRGVTRSLNATSLNPNHGHGKDYHLNVLLHVHSWYE